jgi:hypothetical protein
MLSRMDPLALTYLDQLLFLLKILFTFLTKQATLMRRLTVLSLPPQLVFPDLAYFAPPSMTNKKVFIAYMPGPNVIKKFTSVIYKCS